MTHDEISRRAEELWRQYGSPSGRDEEIWLEAERQLRGNPLDQVPPTSEGVGSNQTSPSAPAATPPAAQKPRETELMERTIPPATPRSSKNRSQRSGEK